MYKLSMVRVTDGFKGLYERLVRGVNPRPSLAGRGAVRLLPGAPDDGTAPLSTQVRPWGTRMTEKWSLSWADTGIICIILILLVGFYIVNSGQMEILTALERQEVTAAAVALTEGSLEELNATWEAQFTEAEDAWGMAMGSGVRSAYEAGYSEGYWDGLSASLKFNVTAQFPWITDPPPSDVNQTGG